MAERRLAAALCLLSTLLLRAGAMAQDKPVRAASPRRHPRVVKLPQGSLTRIPSPDRKWTLVFEFHQPPEDPAGCVAAGEVSRKLWIERTGSKERKFIREFERSLDISWSPDSRHFFINDASGSSDTLSYVYDPENLKAVDLLTVLNAASPRLRRFRADHFYVEAKHWINSEELLVTVDGYLSSTPPGPGLSGVYRVNLNGAVYPTREGYWR